MHIYWKCTHVCALICVSASCVSGITKRQMEEIGDYWGRVKNIMNKSLTDILHLTRFS